MFNYVISDLTAKYKSSVKNGGIIYVDATATVQHDPLLLKFMESTIGASLLIKGKAALWSRSPLKSYQNILASEPDENQPDQKTYFHFPDVAEAFLSGQVIREPATKRDMLDFDLNFTKADTLRATIHAEVKRNITDKTPTYPGGIESLQDYVQSNFPGNCWNKTKQQVLLVHFLVKPDGYIDENSIAVVNNDVNAGHPCIARLKAILLKSKRWTPSPNYPKPFECLIKLRRP